MALIRRADAELVAREAIVLDLSRLERQRDVLIESAQRRAEQILADAQTQRDQIVSGAFEAGHTQGHESGRNEGLREGRSKGSAEALEEVRQTLEQLVRSWTDALEAFEDERGRMLHEARTDVVRLACQIASRATGRLLETDPTLIENELAEVLALVSAPTRLRVRVHPDDEPMLRNAVPALLARFESRAHVELVPDAECARGACVAVTERQGVIDASVGTKLDRLVRSIVPDPEVGR